jgi:hypothetical protein
MLKEHRQDVEDFSTTGSLSSGLEICKIVDVKQLLYYESNVSYKDKLSLLRK